jgi:hypothetical protein
MFVKLNKSGGRLYAQLAESFRDELGRPRNRVIVTLGRVDRVDPNLESVLTGLLRATGRGTVEPVPTVEFERSLAFGDVWALHQLWHQLGLDRLGELFRSRRDHPTELLLRLMVFNRLCDPRSKLGVLRWLRTTAVPGLASCEDIAHAHLLRAMDDWEAIEPKVHAHLATLLRPLVDTELSVVFYDVTTVGVCGETELPGDVRAYGRSKHDTIERQFALGLVQTADGLPIAYEVFEGNVAETTTLMPMVHRVLQRYAISRVVLVADRGLLSLDNLEQIRALRLPSGQPLEFVLAVPARRYVEFAPIVAGMGPRTEAGAPAQWVDEHAWQPPGEPAGQPALRLVVAHDSEQARLATQRRLDKLQELQALASSWSGKLDAQDGGARPRGRRLSDKGATARLYHAVAQERLSTVLRVDMKGELFAYDIDEAALERLQTLDGKLVLLSNVRDLDPAALVQRYKSLADIERGFRVLKSDIEIGPVYHRLPQRIRAHAGICFLALVLHRVMRMRLRQAGNEHSPTSALSTLSQLQQHHVALNGLRPVRGLGRIDTLQQRLFSALGIPQPRTENLPHEQLCLGL